MMPIIYYKSRYKEANFLGCIVRFIYANKKTNFWIHREPMICFISVSAMYDTYHIKNSMLRIENRLHQWIVATYIELQRSVSGYKVGPMPKLSIKWCKQKQRHKKLDRKLIRQWFLEPFYVGRDNYWWAHVKLANITGLLLKTEGNY